MIQNQRVSIDLWGLIMSIDYAIILGAGASKADGAPLQGELFKDYFNSKSNNPKEKKLRENLKTFFFSYFGVDVDSSDLNKVIFPTFEEVLGILEMAIQREERFENSTPRNSSIEQIRTNLILMIALILDKKLKGRNKFHKKLVRNLIDASLLYRTTFLSLNYDILIDNALADVNQQHDLDYCLEFTNYREEEDWHRPDPTKAVKLFKIHGSLNWLYCPTCLSLTLTPQKKGVREFIYEPKKCFCPSCNNMTNPIIVPPTFFKVMSNYYLQQVWHAVEKELRNVKKLIFCGYSFPDADIHIKYLLKRIELSRNSEVEVVIINHFIGKKKIVKDMEKERFIRFFNDHVNVIYTTMSFETFSESGYMKFIS